MPSKTQKKDLLKAAKREKTFATLAKKEGEGAAKRARIEHGAAKEDSKWEAGIDKRFSRVRTARANSYKRQANER